MKNTNDFNAEARYYDLLERKNGPLFDGILRYLTMVFRRARVRTILDATCGTGAPAIPLSVRGFRVLGSDKAPALLKIARGKSRGMPRVRFGRARYNKRTGLLSTLWRAMIQEGYGRIVL
ncbi:MAG: hypothetical protein AAB368_11810, partial [bacterium]